MRRLGDDQMHVAVQSCAGIPTGGFGQVLQAHCQDILLPRTQLTGDVEMETIIAIGPITHLLAIHIDTRMTHRPIEEQRCPLPGGELRHLESQAIPTDTDEWQSSRTTGMLHRLRLSILRNGHLLLVVLRTERAIDRPIVWHRDVLPIRIRTRYLLERRIICPGETPPLLQQMFCTSLGTEGGHHT